MKHTSTQANTRHPESISRKKNYQQKQQQEIAVETARLMSEEGIDNIHSARRKAAHKLGIHNEHSLPDDNEVLFQIKIHQSLYQSSSHQQLLNNLRTTAFNAMKLLNKFKPLLIGPVLQGYAHEHSSIDILLRADSAEEIAVFLMAHDIPYQLRDWKLFFGKPKSHSSSKSSLKEQAQSVPAYQVYADKHTINLIVLLENHRKMLPLEPGNWQTIQSASLAQLDALLKEESEQD